MDIADGEAGGSADRIVDQGCAVGDTGHALARGVELKARAVVVRLQDRPRVVADADVHAKGRGDTVGGDIVVGRADATRSEHMGISQTERIDRLDDHLMHIRHNPHLGQPYPHLREPRGEMLGVGVKRSAREDLVADHKHRGGRIGHRLLLWG